MADIAIKDESGNDLGFSIKIGPAPAEPLPDDETGLKTLASRITGWSKTVVDGETYAFSKERALALLARFPHIAKQCSAAKDDASAGKPAVPTKTESKP